jgi:hypothetical protein
MIEGLRPNAYDARVVARFLFVLLAGLLLLTVLAFRESGAMLTDPDTYWHIATGRLIWETGSLPRVDQFSYTFRGHNWTAENWLAQLMLFGAYSLEGWRGVVLLTSCAAIFSYGVMFLVLSRQMRPTVVVGIVAVAFVFSVSQFNARPKMFVDGLMILWVATLVDAVENKSPPPFLLLPIVTLWANLHPIVAFGIGLAGALGAEAVLYSPSGARIETAKKWGFFLVLAAAAACITPYGYAPVLHAFQVFSNNEAVAFIQEWKPVAFNELGAHELILLGLLTLALYQGVRISMWRLLITVGLFYMMMSHIRFASLFAFLTPVLLAPPLLRQFPFLRLSTHLEQDPEFFLLVGRYARWGLYPAIALIMLGTVAYGAWGGQASPPASITPAGAIDYVRRENLTGNIYNPYGFGGYLIFRNIKTFIDGRTEELFLGGFTKRVFGAINDHPRKFIPLLNEYNVTLALVVPGSREAEELEATEGWEKVYSDKVSELYEKR